MVYDTQIRMTQTTGKHDNENHTPEKRLEEKEKEHELTQVKNGNKIGEVQAKQEEDIIIKQ